MRTACLLITPLLVAAAAGALYTHLNIDRRLFVEWLGCGCQLGFNTNWMSLIVCLVLLAPTVLACWLGSRGLSRRWRIRYLVAVGVGALVFFHQFMYHNLWL